MATHGNLFLKMMACGDRLREAQRLEENAEARFVAHRTAERSDEWMRARHLVDNLAGNTRRRYALGANPFSRKLPAAKRHSTSARRLASNSFLAGLPEPEIAAIAEHFRTCEECRCRKDVWCGIVGETAGMTLGRRFA